MKLTTAGKFWIGYFTVVILFIAIGIYYWWGNHETTIPPGALDFVLYPAPLWGWALDGAGLDVDVVTDFGGATGAEGGAGGELDDDAVGGGGDDLADLFWLAGDEAQEAFIRVPAHGFRS